MELLQKRPPEQSSAPCHRSSHRALNLTLRDHSGRACHIASPPAHCFLGIPLNARREIDSVAVRSINLLSPLSDACRAPGFDTGDKTRAVDYEWQSTEEAEESKKEAVCLCSRGGMRKCPRSVSNLSEGGQATFSRRGKARLRRSSHRRVGLPLHGPIRGYMEEKETQKERRKSKEEAWFWRPVSRVCLCPMTPSPHTYTHTHTHTHHHHPPLLIIHPFPLHHTPTHKVAVRVCLCEFS